MKSSKTISSLDKESFTSIEKHCEFGWERVDFDFSGKHKKEIVKILLLNLIY